MPETPEKSTIFWAVAKGMQIGNFIPEKRVAGRIDQREGSIRFNNHIFVSIDPKEIKFVRESMAFKNGHVKEVASIAEATGMTLRAERAKNARLRDQCDMSSVEMTDFKENLHPPDEQTMVKEAMEGQ